jgi:hypothetical protein
MKVKTKTWTNTESTKSTQEQHCHWLFEDYKSFLDHPILKRFTICQFSHKGLCRRFFHGVDS